MDKVLWPKNNQASHAVIMVKTGPYHLRVNRNIKCHYSQHTILLVKDPQHKNTELSLFCDITEHVTCSARQMMVC